MLLSPPAQAHSRISTLDRRPVSPWAGGCADPLCLAVKERLRCRAILQMGVDPDLLLALDSEDDRGELPTSLRTELGLLLVIELSDGKLLLTRRERDLAALQSHSAMTTGPSRGTWASVMRSPSSLCED